MYQTAAQIRAAVSDLADTSKFPDAVIENHVETFARIVENYRGVSYEPRTTVQTIFTRSDPRTALTLFFPKIRSITSVTVTSPAVDGTTTTLTATDYTHEPDLGILHGSFASNSKVVVVYVHGLGYRTLTDGVTTNADATVTSVTGGFITADIGLPVSGTGIPDGAQIASINSATSIELTVNATASATVTLTIEHPIIVDACRQYVRSCALAGRSGVPRDVISQNVEGTVNRFSTPDKNAGRPTGYLDVDRLLNSLPDFRPSF